MKTKSKRFVNLATLCLALLGTTLLMGRPVKADGVTDGVSESLQHQEQLDSEVGETENSKQHGSTVDPYREYLEGRDAGYEAGYRDGNKLGAPKEVGKGPHVPLTNPYDDDETEKKQDYESGYSDAYDGGYSDGWRNAHPIQAFLDMAWHFLAYTIGGLFGNHGS
ncbi:TPA: hypothetical protein ACF4ZG_001381 [Streptococcus pyogenes]|uniref:hypothetical protein n=1 Tax=Streptococcus pyogenes TaxID=1314 RepID=UPI002B39CEA9|nr:hypothetical protein [Streptococcus pyogenes]HER4668507.1 hypothetical protein [Streptococcus pyogenes NGAS401]HER4761632.1 hypothetical protein [Streptococcus pyogenes NGAS227]HEQ1408849.1 hypothetical protein [Streptococcus pyogenes]HEQ8737867.1 hypothetical protein [Streptococcus pyogenes]